MGSATEPLPASDLAQGIRGALEAGAVDLDQVTGIIERVLLPAAPGASPLLSAFGETFQLDIPRTPKDRTEWAGKTGQSKKQK